MIQQLSIIFGFFFCVDNQNGGVGIVRNAFIPNVSPGIQQIQAFLHLLQSDSFSAFVGFGFGEVAVFAGKPYDPLWAFRQTDADERRFVAANAVFERILDERNEYQRRNAGVAVGRNVELRGQLNVIRKPYPHQVDVISHEVHLLRQRYESLIIIV